MSVFQLQWVGREIMEHGFKSSSQGSFLDGQD